MTSCQIDGETMETVKTLFSWAPKSLQMVTEAGKLKDACSFKKKIKSLLHRRKSMTNLDSVLKRHRFPDKGPYSQSYGFSSGHVWM